MQAAGAAAVVAAVAAGAEDSPMARGAHLLLPEQLEGAGGSQHVQLQPATQTSHCSSGRQAGHSLQVAVWLQQVVQHQRNISNSSRSSREEKLQWSSADSMAINVAALS
jgi:hypothetical protein